MFLKFFAPGILVAGLVLLGIQVFRLLRKKIAPGNPISWMSIFIGGICLSPFVLMVLNDPVFSGANAGGPSRDLSPDLTRDANSAQSPGESKPGPGRPRVPGKPLLLGSAAPDFTLPSLDTGHLVHLADLLQHKPVVLVFGSFGCAYFCSRLDRVKDLQQRYGDRADFLFVYIDNQHAEPEPLQSAIADASAPLDAPVNRMARIRAGLEHYDLSLPCVIDSKSNKVQHDYNAFPARLVIVDQKRKVAFDSGSVLQSGLNPTGAAAWLEENTSITKSIPKSRPLVQ